MNQLAITPTNADGSDPSSGSKYGFRIKLLSVIVAVSGVVLILAAVSVLAGFHDLLFLLDGFGIIGGLSVPAAASIVITLGLVNILLALGLWQVKLWAFGLGLTVSVTEISISLLSLNFTSFIFIRGLIVLVYLLRIRDSF